MEGRGEKDTIVAIEGEVRAGVAKEQLGGQLRCCWEPGVGRALLLERLWGLSVGEN
jgi:hypothetical protein